MDRGRAAWPVLFLPWRSSEWLLHLTNGNESGHQPEGHLVRVWMAVWIIRILSDTPDELPICNTAQKRLPAPVGWQNSYLGCARCTPYAIPCLCFGAEDQDVGLHALYGQPKTVDEAVDRMLYYQFTWHHRLAGSVRKMSLCVEHHLEESPMAEELVRIRSRREKIEQTLGKCKYNPKWAWTRCRVGHAWLQLGRCYYCGEVDHLQRDCRTCSWNGNTGRNQCKQRKHTRKSRRKPVSSGIDSVSQRTTAYDSSHPSLVSCQQEVSMSPSGHERKRNRKQRTQLHCHLTRYSGTLDGLEEEGERTRPCEPVSNSQGIAVFAVCVDVNGMALDGVVDTGAEVCVLSKEAYQLMDPRPPVKKCITILQAGKDSEVEEFIAGPFNICTTMKRTCEWPPWRTGCCWVWMFCSIEGFALTWTMELWN